MNSIFNLTIQRVNRTSVLFTFSFLISIISNNLLNKISYSVYSGNFNLSSFLKPDLMGYLCKSNSADTPMMHFYIFLVAKMILVASAFAIYYFLKSDKKRKLLTEAILLYLIFDVVYVALQPLNFLFELNLPYYFFSSGPQYLTIFINLPSYLAPLFWSAVLLMFLLISKQFSWKQFRFRFLLSAFSFCWIIGLLLFSRPLLVAIARLLFAEA